LRAETRRCRRSPTVLTGAIPFGAFPSCPGGHRHRAIAGAFTECPSPLVVGPLPRCPPAEADGLFRSRPHLRGFPARSPLLASTLPKLVRPMLPWAFLRLWAFTPDPAGDTRQPKPLAPCSDPDRSRALQTAHPPKRIREANKTVASEPSDLHCCRLRDHREDPGSRSRARGLPRAPRCRSTALAPQPSRAHRCRCTA
jgi:hypothetical protein